MPLALLALTIGAFAIGTTEFVIVGLVPTIAEQLAISLPSAGLLVSIYALGVAIGAPVLTALTGRMPRKQLLLALMALFTAGNLLAWQAPGYETLVLARLLTGLAHGVFFSIGSTIATSLVPKEKAASAIAIMFGGLTVALVTGVPLGTFIGQHFGWRETFLAVSILGVIALMSSLILVPNNIPGRVSAGLRAQLQVLTHPRLLIIYAITALGYGGVFTAFTFLAPMMQDLAGFSPAAVSWILLGYGVSVAVGNVWGGRLADKHGAVPALKLIFAALVALLLIFQFTASLQYAALATVLYYQASQHMTVQARAMIDKALALDSNEITALMLLASDAFMQANYAQAIELWQKVMDLNSPRINRTQLVESINMAKLLQRRSD